MPNTQRENGVRVSQRIRKAIANQSFRSTDDQPVSMTLSAGVVQLSEHHNRVEQLLDEVCQLTLQAKQQGRNRVCG
jgi:diguanylate cyclase (GGDEF)-like protein